MHAQGFRKKTVKLKTGRRYEKKEGIAGKTIDATGWGGTLENYKVESWGEEM